MRLLSHLTLLLFASTLEGEGSSTILEIWEWSLRCFRTFLRYRSKLFGGRSQTAADGGTGRVSVKVSPQERVKKSLCFPRLENAEVTSTIPYAHASVVVRKWMPELNNINWTLPLLGSLRTAGRFCDAASVTINCQITKIVSNPGSQLSLF